MKSLISGSSLSSGKFLIDSTLGRDTVYGIYVEDEEDKDQHHDDYVF